MRQTGSSGTGSGCFCSIGPDVRRGRLVVRGFGRAFLCLSTVSVKMVSFDSVRRYGRTETQGL